MYVQCTHDKPKEKKKKMIRMIREQNYKTLNAKPKHEEREK